MTEKTEQISTSKKDMDSSLLGNLQIRRREGVVNFDLDIEDHVYPSRGL